MGKSHFQFKQFGISQLRCAMKVSTDACLLGAWAPFKAGISQVLDIGCGTGLLSLMTAQRFPQASITAVELDADAAGEAAENIAGSPWAGRIEGVQANVLTHDFKGRKFDAIICNPPFFQKSLGAQTAARHTARHDDDLPLGDLLLTAAALLATGGQLALLLPPATQAVWEGLSAGSGLVQVQKVLVRPLPQKAHNRVLSIWEKGALAGRGLTEELTIYENYSYYTPTAKDLLAPFLLYL